MKVFGENTGYSAEIKQNGYTEAALEIKENWGMFQILHKYFSQYLIRMLIMYLSLVVDNTGEW